MRAQSSAAARRPRVRLKRHVLGGATVRRGRQLRRRLLLRLHLLPLQLRLKAQVATGSSGSLLLLLLLRPRAAAMRGDRRFQHGILGDAGERVARMGNALGVARGGSSSSSVCRSSR